MYGRVETRPVFASAYAASSAATDGESSIVPACWGPTPGRHVKCGSSDSARLTFTTEPVVSSARTRATNSSGGEPAGIKVMNVLLGSVFDSTTGARTSVATARATPVDRPCSTRTDDNCEVVRIF